MIRLLRVLALLVALGALLAPPALGQPGRSYLVPSDNPFARGGGAPEVWSYGLRNPYRFSFDRATGDLLIGDVGANDREEVDFLARGRGGANFGWPCREGKIAGPKPCANPSFVEPIFDYPTPSPQGAITGGYVVRDGSLSGLVGRYLYADFYGGEIRSIRVDAAAPNDTPAGLPPSPTLSSFGEDAAGRLYTTNLGDGTLYRLTAGTAPGTLSRVLVAGGFTMPTHVAAPPGDSSRLFVVERSGRIRVVLNGSTLGEPFLDISSDVSTDSERGLLSMAFPPDYASSGRFYVYYTDLTGDIQIVEFRRSASNPNRADSATRRGVLTVEHSSRGNHNGGQLQFGPDGYLYIATGDGGGQGDPDNNGQNTGTLLGKVLRIDPDPTTSGPSRDITGPQLRTRVPRRQRVRRRRGPGVIAYARCNESCTVAMSARVRIGRRSYKLKRITRRARPGRRIKLRVRLTRRSSRALRRALRTRTRARTRRRRSTVRVALRARDGAGNRSRLVRVLVRVRR